MMMDTDAGGSVGDALREAAEAALLTLRHARVFIASREKMHPDGQALYDTDIDALASALLTLPSDAGFAACSGGEGVREAIAAAIAKADQSFRYSFNLTRLVDGEETYTLLMNGFEPIDFEDRDDGYLLIAQRRNAARSDAVLAALATTPLPGASPARDSDTHPKGGDASGSGSAE